jgi:tetratricopeptide (TPR) repeat protein
MNVDTIAGFLDALRATRLLEPGQLEELTQSDRSRFTGPGTMADTLVGRGWLTPFQVTRLMEGHVSKAGRHEEAVRILSRAALLNEGHDPPIAIPYRELGMAYSRWNKERMALDWLQKAVEIDPQDAEAHGIIGGVYKQHLDLDKAIESYDRGYEVKPSSTYCLLNAVILRMICRRAGDALKVKKLLEEAAKWTGAAIATPDADHWGLYDHAHVLLLRKDLPGALSYFDGALRRTPTLMELESARKNLDLLRDAEVPILGLDEVLRRFDARERDFALAPGA